MRRWFTTQLAPKSMAAKRSDMPGASFNKCKSETSVSTPDEFMNAVESRFGRIDFDLAADAVNSKAWSWYDEQEDSLIQSWDELHHGTVDGPYHNLWLNPPYDDISPWVKKCSEYSGASTILTLIPASVGSNWFRDYIHNKSLVIALNGRIKFVGHMHPYPKDLMLCVYGVTPGFEVWDWKKEIK